MRSQNVSLNEPILMVKAEHFPVLLAQCRRLDILTKERVTLLFCYKTGNQKILLLFWIFLTTLLIRTHPYKNIFAYPFNVLMWFLLYCFWKSWSKNFVKKITQILSQNFLNNSKIWKILFLIYILTFFQKNYKSHRQLNLVIFIEYAKRWRLFTL